MGHDDWKFEGDGWWYNQRPDGTWLVWNESWGGNKNQNHVHISDTSDARQFGNYKPLRQWFNENIRK